MSRGNRNQPPRDVRIELLQPSALDDSETLALRAAVAARRGVDAVPATPSPWVRAALEAGIDREPHPHTTG